MEEGDGDTDEDHNHQIFIQDMFSGITNGSMSVDDQTNGGSTGKFQESTENSVSDKTTEVLPSEIVENLVSFCQGDSSNMTRPKEKLVRLFVSSTFSDTHVERTYLMKTLFPRIKKLCREKFSVDFQYVDMRWGVRDEMANDHQVENLCQKEIENSKRVSAGPYFLALIGQRYGGILPPRTITDQEFNHLLKGAEGGGHVDAMQSLTKWYQLDENSVPPEHLLKPITAEIPDYGSEDPELRKKSARKWTSEMANLTNSLQLCAQSAYDADRISQSQKDVYFCSVTEKEVISGLLQNGESESEHSRSLIIFREISDIEDNLTDSNAWRFIDMTGDAIDENSRSKIASLREKLLAKFSPVEETGNICHLNTQFSALNSGNDSSEAEAYLVEFEKAVEGKLISLIENAFTGRNVFSADDPVDSAAAFQRDVEQSALYYEITSHMTRAKELSENMKGRECIIQQMMDYIELGSDDRRSMQPLTLYGDSGIGKSCIMGAITCEAKKRWPDSIVFLRFLGTSSLTSSVTGVLYSLWAQLYLALYSNRGDNSTTNIVKALQSGSRDISVHKLMLNQVLERVPSHQKVIIILDSLDQLSSSDKAYTLDWLPCNLPPNISIILSTLPEEHGLLLNINRRLRLCGLAETNTLSVPQLSQTMSMEVVQKVLSCNNRQITAEQMQFVKTLLRNNGVGLFVKLVSQEILKWRSFDTDFRDSLSGTLRKVIHKLFQDLEVKHGSCLVCHALGYLTAVDVGLTEEELEHILSLDDQVLNSVFQYHVPPIRRLPPLLWTRVRADLGQFLSNRLWHANAKKFERRRYSRKAHSGRKAPSYEGKFAIDSISSTVVAWFHRQFHEVAKERYLPDLKSSNYLYKNLADFYLGTWAAGREKPFLCSERVMTKLKLKSPEGEADRKVPSQPLVVLTKNADGTVLPPDASGLSDVIRIYTVDTSLVTPHFNYRKLLILPLLLRNAGMLDRMQSECGFNRDWLIAKRMTFPDSQLVADFNLGSRSRKLRIQKEILLQPPFVYINECPIPFFPYEIFCHQSSTYNLDEMADLHVNDLYTACHNSSIEAAMPFVSRSPISPALRGNMHAVFETDATEVGCMSLSVDGCRLIVCAGFSLSFWDVEASRCVTQLFNDALPLYNAMLVLSSSRLILYNPAEGRIGSFSLDKNRTILSLSASLPVELLGDHTASSVSSLRSFTTLTASSNEILCAFDRGVSVTLYGTSDLTCLKKYNRSIIDVAPHDAAGFFFAHSNKVMVTTLKTHRISCSSFVGNSTIIGDQSSVGFSGEILRIAFDQLWKYMYVVTTDVSYIFDCVGTPGDTTEYVPVYSVETCPLLNQWTVSTKLTEGMVLVASHGVAVLNHRRGSRMLRVLCPLLTSISNIRMNNFSEASPSLFTRNDVHFLRVRSGCIEVYQRNDNLKSDQRVVYKLLRRIQHESVRHVVQIGNQIAISSERSGVITVLDVEARQSQAKTDQAPANPITENKEQSGNREYYRRFSLVTSRYQPDAPVVVRDTSSQRRNTNSTLYGLCHLNKGSRYGNYIIPWGHLYNERMVPKNPSDEKPSIQGHPSVYLADTPGAVCVTKQGVAFLTAERKLCFVHIKLMNMGRKFDLGSLDSIDVSLTFNRSGRFLLLFHYSENQFYILDLKKHMHLVDSSSTKPAVKSKFRGKPPATKTSNYNPMTKEGSTLHDGYTGFATRNSDPEKDPCFGLDYIEAAGGLEDFAEGPCVADFSNSFNYSHPHTEGEQQHEYIHESITLMEDESTLVCVLKSPRSSNQPSSLESHLGHFRLGYLTMGTLLKKTSTDNLLPTEFSVGSYFKRVRNVKFQALRVVEGGRRLVLMFGIQIFDSEAKLMDGLVIYRDLDNPAQSGWSLSENAISSSCASDHSLQAMGCDQVTIMLWGKNPTLSTDESEDKCTSEDTDVLVSTYFDPFPSGGLVGKHILKSATDMEVPPHALETSDPLESMRFLSEGTFYAWKVASEVVHGTPVSTSITAGNCERVSNTATFEKIFDDVKVIGGREIIMMTKSQKLIKPGIHFNTELNVVSDDDDDDDDDDVSDDEVCSSDDGDGDSQDRIPNHEIPTAAKIHEPEAEPESSLSFEVDNAVGLSAGVGLVKDTATGTNQSRLPLKPHDSVKTESAIDRIPSEKDPSMTLRGPLSRALEKVADVRPSDPIAYLSTYLRQWKVTGEKPTNPSK